MARPIPLVPLACRELLRRLGVLVSLIGGRILWSLGVLVPLVALLPLRILRLLPPLGNGLGLIGTHAVPPKIPATLTLSPRYVPITIISHPLRCHLVTGDNIESHAAFGMVWLGCGSGFGRSFQTLGFHTRWRTFQYQGVRLPICQNARST